MFSPFQSLQSAAQDLDRNSVLSGTAASRFLLSLHCISPEISTMQMPPRFLDETCRLSLNSSEEGLDLLVSDSVKMKQTYSSLLAEKQAKAKQLQQVNSSLESQKAKIAHVEEQMKAYLAQAAKTSVENRHIAINLDKAKLELVDSEKELKWLKSAVDITEKEHQRNEERILDLRMELEKERNERKKLEEEYEDLKKEVMELSPERQELAIQKLEDEIKECKAILKCGVCFDRPKEVVITKCFHLFCNPCIQRNLEIRHRKCPGCGTPFGQNDVREVNI
ncbi:hypothetical protein M5K25_004132 [Dendrobium thyrsiflorum]|uniref:E3 ubiquitin protein ligase n=1 Tax=Dendrobium thyrsiflorum TaxID=117978 RepID=A0ABD0VTA8_DENTH